MMTLTLDMETSAMILGASLDKLREAIQRQEIAGVHIGGEWRISIFALAKLLDTSPHNQHFHIASFLIPDVDLSFESFPKFLKAREEMIMSRLADLLGVGRSKGTRYPVGRSNCSRSSADIK